MTPYGPYQLVRRLAVGGMAEVFLARWSDPPAGEADARLVVKRILPHLEDKPQFVRMFLDEARLTAQLFHPNVVQIHDFGKADGVHYIAMEYVDGQSLRQLLREAPGEPLPLPLSCLVVSEACAALAYAHTKTGVGGGSLGIVHRDVSPDNILLSRAGEVKLADFGIAKASIHLSRTRPGQIKGKLAYMSPEQALRGQIDHRSDIFALGAVLFEVSTGRRLFDGPNDAHVLEALLRGEYPDPRELLADYSPQLAEVVNRALQHRPAERYESARAMRRALLELLPSRQSAAIELSRRISAAVARADDERPRGRDGQRTEVAQLEGGTVPGVGPARPAKVERPGAISQVTRRYSSEELLDLADDHDTIEEAPAVTLDDALDAVSTGETVPEARAVMSVSVAPSSEAPIARAPSQLTTAEMPESAVPISRTSDRQPELVIAAGESSERPDLTGPRRRQRRRPSADLQATRPRAILDAPLVDDDDDGRETTRRAAIDAAPPRPGGPAAAPRAARAASDAPAAAGDRYDGDAPARYDPDDTDVVDAPELAPARVDLERPLPYLWIGIAIALVSSVITLIALL